MNTIYRRQECIAQADHCRLKAQSDPARHDYWIDEAVVWLQRALETRDQTAFAPEIGDRRMIARRTH